MSLNTIIRKTLTASAQHRLLTIIPIHRVLARRVKRHRHVLQRVVRPAVRHIVGDVRERPHRVGVPLDLQIAHRRTQIPEDVVALLREGDLVHRVPYEAGLEQVRRVLPGVPPFLEPLDVRQEPVDHVGADEGVGYRYFEPHPVPDLQAAVGPLHGLYYRGHGRVDGEGFLQIWKA